MRTRGLNDVEIEPRCLHFPMHYRLDLIGGLAGDMFSAAMLDLHPEWLTPLRDDLAVAQLGTQITVGAHPHNDGVLTGTRFEIVEPDATDGTDPHHHRHWRDIRKMLDTSSLSDAVRTHAIGIFELLADAEASVHGKDVDDVAFHEVGNWDSIGDIVSAAWMIDRASADSWSCSSIPAGNGRVASAHGSLPLPAPATALLLRGCPLHDDGVEGERVTPTGAAILRYLAPSFGARPTATLDQIGTGFGTKRFAEFSNIARVSTYIPHVSPDIESITVCEFEVDDQTAEDLAVALDNLRMAPGVLDVVQMPVFAKKGRISTHVRLLIEPGRSESVIEMCLNETTTIGVRSHEAERRTLPRSLHEVTTPSGAVTVKTVQRPDGHTTAKADMDDLAGTTDGHTSRQRLRRLAEEDASQ